MSNDILGSLITAALAFFMSALLISFTYPMSRKLASAVEFVGVLAILAIYSWVSHYFNLPYNWPLILFDTMQWWYVVAVIGPTVFVFLIVAFVAAARKPKAPPES